MPFSAEGKARADISIHLQEFKTIKTCYFVKYSSVRMQLALHILIELTFTRTKSGCLLDILRWSRDTDTKQVITG